MATEVTLEARPRTDEEHGTRACRRLRRAGQVPAVLYGGGTEVQSVAVEARDLNRVLATEAGLNVLINLAIGADGAQLAMARQISRHPLRDQILHLDFIAVSREDRVTAEVPLVLTGEAHGVKEEGGVLQQQLNTIRVEAPVIDVPQSIELDVTHLQLGSSLHVSNVATPAGSEILNDPETVVVSVVQTSASRMLEEEEAALAEAEAAEGEAVEGEGAAETEAAGEGGED
ncbi:MAG: 50S ribosomal protein L25 [Acidimicrobiia bacterium]|nr:50S ribosomal protein L25 [Acidimicrobiia bacterium]